MKYVKHTWPGLANPVYLPDTLPAKVALIPKGTPGWWRGVSATKQTTFTQHFTGNMNSSAQSEWNWAADGGRAEIGSLGSYQLIVDGHQAIVAEPFDEAAGHAANDIGNMTSFASEMAIAGGYEAAFQNAAHVAAGVIVSKGWQVDTSLLQHWNWLRANGTRKNCPSIIRDKGDWSRFVSTVSKNAAAIRTFLAGDKPAPTPIYAKPSPIPVLDAVSRANVVAPTFVTIPNENITAFFVGDRYKAIRNTPRRQFAYLTSPVVGPDLKAGETFDIDFVFENKDGVWGYTPWGTRVLIADLQRISDQKAA